MNQVIMQEILSILEQVTDPEIPVLTIRDLGVLRDVQVEGDKITVFISPTYSGCPAMDAISLQIRLALREAGHTQVEVRQVLSPAWTTDWMTEEGKQKLQAYGIAPPIGKSLDNEYLEQLQVPCPQCHSTNTYLIAAFGSTSCKALFRCDDCKEPFDYFKCH